MKVHYFMPYVITAYSVLAIPKTTNACMVCTTEFKFLWQSELEGKSVRKDATIMAFIKEVCGNVFASAVYDKRWAVKWT